MILIVSAVFPPEPVVSANLSFDIANELAGKYEVTVVSPKPTRPYKKTFKENTNDNYSFIHQVLKSYTCPESKIIGRFYESYSFGKASAQYIKRNHTKIKLIYANTWPLFAQQLVVKTASKYNIPVILHVQDIYPESLSSKLPGFLGKLIQTTFLPFDKSVLKRASRILTISPQMKNYLVKSRNLYDTSVYVIRNWQNDEYFQNYKLTNKNKPSSFTFMYLGNISPSAGVELLISAFAKANLDSCRLIIAGNGSSRSSCETLAQKFPKSNIEFWEAAQDKVPELQAKADVLLLPLKKGIGKTASPSKLPAYMFSKKPVIASVDYDSDPADIIRSADSGWVIEPEDENTMVETMMMVNELSCDLLKEKGENGFNYAIKNLSRKRNLQQVVSLFEQSIQ